MDSCFIFYISSACWAISIKFTDLMARPVPYITAKCHADIFSSCLNIYTCIHVYIHMYIYIHVYIKYMIYIYGGSGRSGNGTQPLV